MCRYLLLFVTCSLLAHLNDAIPRAVDNMKPTAEDMFFHLNTPQEEFKVPDLPFKFNEMEPIIDAATMEIHHSVIFKVPFKYEISYSEFSSLPRLGRGSANGISP